MHETVIGLDRIPPASSKRNADISRAIRTAELHEFRRAGHASRVFVAVDAHGNNIPAGLDEFPRHCVDAEVRPRIRALGHGDAANLHVVEISRIALVGGADGKSQVAPDPRRRNLNRFTEPDDAAVIQPTALP